MANWEEHYTGIMETNFIGVGVTEIEFQHQFLLLYAAFHDPIAVKVRDVA